jgi:hypothetical protein
MWPLLLLALAGYLPCVLLPAWRDYQAVALAAQIEQRRAEAMRQSVQKQRRAVEAVRTDPAVVTRLAQRELAFVRLGETQVEVPGVRVVSGATAPPPLEPVGPPAAVERIVARLPDADYDRVFCEEPARTMVMLLSGGVLVAAFAIGGPSRRGQGGDSAL